MNHFTVCTFVTLCVVCVASSQSAAQPPHVRTNEFNDALANFAIPVDGNGFLIVPIDVAGKRRLAVLDTGATFSAYDKALRPVLGEVTGSTTANSPGGKRVIELFASPDVGIAGIRIKNCNGTVGCEDLVLLRRAIGHDIRAIIGMDVLRQFVVAIDFPQRTFCLRNHLPDGQVKTNKVPIRYFGGAPWVPVRIGEDTGAWFQIDTGSRSDSFGTLSKQLFDDLSRRGAIKKLRTTETTTLFDKLQTRTGELACVLVVGEQGYPEAPFTESAYCSLGLKFLSPHVVTLDFPGDSAYLDIAVARDDATGQVKQNAGGLSPFPSKSRR